MRNKNESGIAFPALLVLILLILGLGGYFYFTKFQSGNGIIQNAIQKTGGKDSPFGKLFGNAGENKGDCDGSECSLLDSFDACQPSVHTVGALRGYMEYEILGKKNEGCEVNISYKDMPGNPYNDKSMICVMSTNVDFFTSIEKTINKVIDGSLSCDGSLYSELRSGS